MKKIIRHCYKWWRRHVPAWVITGATLALIFWLTLAREPLPETNLPLFPGADKLVHAVMFAWLTFVLALDWRSSLRFGRFGAKQLLVCAGLSILMGGLVELAQWAMNVGRSADWGDFTADAIGALLAMAWLMKKS